MNKIQALVFIALTALSCGGRRSSTSAVQATEVPFSIDSFEITGAPYLLCDQQLTSVEAIYANDVSEENNYSYDREATPIEETFFFPEGDIQDSEVVRRVQLR